MENTPSENASRGEERLWLTDQELAKIEASLKGSRHELRDLVAFRLMFHHGLRISECCYLEWKDIDFEKGKIYIKRLKGSNSSTQTISKKDLPLLKKLKRLNKSRFIIYSQKDPNVPIRRQSLGDILRKASKKADIEISFHPHMLRHSTGHHLASKIPFRDLQDLLGHSNPQHTAHYTRQADDRFEDYWT